MNPARSDVLILIPAYRPGAPLLALISDLLDRGAEFILVVDDGSGPEFAEFFRGIAVLERVHVLHHATNLGKGAALKTGLGYALARFPDCLGVVTADADGQHLPGDILRVAERLRTDPEALILGARQFDSHVPWRSRIGNTVTRILLRLLVGHKLTDTQTGLRGIPAKLIPHLVQIRSQRYEFELDMLIACRHRSFPISEEPIQTVYLDENESSHFEPIADSMRIYFLLLRFGLLSVLTATLDNIIFVIAFSSTGSVARSQILSRFLAMIFNYAGARGLVFHSQQRHAVVLPKYVLLVTVNGLVSYALIVAIRSRLGVPAILAKMCAEGLLFAASFLLQRDFVFTRKATDGAAGSSATDCQQPAGAGKR
ncbi:MAG TPA: bifunctional glycosyltransferase family 2/GtrA family protein [Bryobacteraceae bacterium]|nr:bifunctional glycosyltransferase family 2/GtrA family protein [Bryobacteraceae bacterium]